MIAPEYWKNYDGCAVIMVLFAQHSSEHYKTVRNIPDQRKKRTNDFSSAFFFFTIPDNDSNCRDLSDTLSLL